MRRRSLHSLMIHPLSMPYFPSICPLSRPPISLTFFAPPDDVLRRPKHCHSQELDWSTLDELSDGMTDPSHLIDFADLGGALDLLDSVDKPHCPGDPEKRKKIIKFILHAILSYHIIPADLDTEKLGLNNTFPTHLKFPHIFDNQPLRLRVQKLIFPPITSVNLFSKILHANILATNGGLTFLY